MKKEKKKKNIALLLPSLSYGGAERVASELSQFFTREGHNVFVFTENKRASYIFHGKVIGFKVKKTNFELLKEISDLYFLSKELGHLKKKFNIDIAISFMEQYNLANILSKNTEKVIARVCTTLSARKDLKGLYYNKFVLKCIYNRADKIVVLTKYSKNDLIKNYRIKKNILEVIPNALISREFDSSIPWKYGTKTILSVGRLHPIKQQWILIDVIKRVVKVIPEAKLLLVGCDTSEYGKKLKKYIKKQKMGDSVIFTGHVENVEYYMYNSRIFLTTSVTEGFPNVVIEAMNQGLPIISTDYPGPPRDILGVSLHRIYGKYGIVVPMINESIKDIKYQENIEILSNKVIEMLLDDELLKKYSKASKKRAQYYNKFKC